MRDQREGALDATCCSGSSHVLWPTSARTNAQRLSAASQALAGGLVRRCGRSSGAGSWARSIEHAVEAAISESLPPLPAGSEVKPPVGEPRRCCCKLRRPVGTMRACRTSACSISGRRIQSDNRSCSVGFRVTGASGRPLYMESPWLHRIQEGPQDVQIDLDSEHENASAQNRFVPSCWRE